MTGNQFRHLLNYIRQQLLAPEEQHVYSSCLPNDRRSGGAQCASTREFHRGAPSGLKGSSSINILLLRSSGLLQISCYGYVSSAQARTTLKKQL